MHTDAPAHTSNTQNKVNQGFESNIDMFEAEPQTQHIMKMLTCSHKMINCAQNIPIKSVHGQPNGLTSAKRRALCACFILKRLIFC